MTRKRLSIHGWRNPWCRAAAVLVLAAAAWFTRPMWSPPVNALVQSAIAAQRNAPGLSNPDAAAHPPDDHGHNHAAEDESSVLELSNQAMRNLGLTPETLQPVRLQTFYRAMTVPAVIVERPGRTRVQVATPMTGVITHVHAAQGEAVRPETLLFQIRLTHEDLVKAQTDFVRTLGEVDVEEREIARLSKAARSGAIAGKVLLEREYARDILNAHLQAQREALRLHGLSDEQIHAIETTRRLLRELRLFAPAPDSHSGDELNLTSATAQRPVSTHPQASDGALILQELRVHKGQSVNAGETLCVLSDLSELYIEGLAFEQDLPALRATSQHGWTVDAVFDQPESGPQVVGQLEVAYLSNEIDADSRTLKFYVRLPNHITKDRTLDGTRYVEWAWLPGQRLQLRVPIEQWPNQIVLPVDAVAVAGAESWVFRKRGSRFVRVPVHVRYRDQHSVVVANDGSLNPGDIVATVGAHQMQMALRNKSGGAVDPHAGHSH